MTQAQRIALLSKLHTTASGSRESMLSVELPHFGTTPDILPETMTRILTLFENGIGKLNVLQLKNLTEEWTRTANTEGIANKLNYYGIAEQFHGHILDYLEGYNLTGVALKVSDIDKSFEGLQVVTRDSFHKLITDGYSGVWKVNRAKVKPLRLQIASMNDDGPHPRGWFIQADITSFEEIEYHGHKRYRIYFKDATTIDSGFRNIKFSQQPVTYIKRNKEKS